MAAQQDMQLVKDLYFVQHFLRLWFFLEEKEFSNCIFAHLYTLTLGLAGVLAASIVEVDAAVRKCLLHHCRLHSHQVLTEQWPTKQCEVT